MNADLNAENLQSLHRNAGDFFSQTASSSGDGAVDQNTSELSDSDGCPPSENENLSDLPFIINLDPAVFDLPYEPNVDIRDTVNYKEVMRQYGLGPNGAILTSLNLFTTKFDQVLDAIDDYSSSSSDKTIDHPSSCPTPSNNDDSECVDDGKSVDKSHSVSFNDKSRDIKSINTFSNDQVLSMNSSDSDLKCTPNHPAASEKSCSSEYPSDPSDQKSIPCTSEKTCNLDVKKQSKRFVLIDTPGQIEIFTWSASGAIITEAIASQYPTILVYVIDTARCERPATFVSNMLYACSILYKMRLPMVIVFNKTDIHPADDCLSWMKDAILLQQAVHEDQERDESYLSTLTSSMGLVLEEFYSVLEAVPVSAFSGDGMDIFWEKINHAHQQYFVDYVPELEERAKILAKRRLQSQEADLARLMGDLKTGAVSED